MTIRRNKDNFEPVLITMPQPRTIDAKGFFNFYIAADYKYYIRDDIGEMGCTYDYYNKDDVFIEDIELKETYRDKGIGTQGIIELIDYAREINIKEIILDKFDRIKKHRSTNMNVDVNQLFYKKLGFSNTSMYGTIMKYSMEENESEDFRDYFNLIPNEELKEKYLSVNV